MQPTRATRLHRRALGWLLAALIPVYLLHWPFVPAWVVPASLFVVALRALRPARWGGRSWRVGTIGLSVAAVLGVVATFHTMLGREAGVSLLLLFTALKLFESETLRDGRIAVLLAILSTNAVFLFDQALWRALLGGVLFLVQVAALIELSAPGERVSIGGRLREAGRLTLLSVPFMLVLFVLFPRISGPLWHVPQQDLARSGLSDEMTPGGIARLVRDDTPAFAVRFQGAPPPPEMRYWRGPVMSAFDGRTWRVAAMDRSEQEAAAWPEGSERLVEQDILLEPHGKRWLFGLDQPLRLDAQGSRTVAGMLLARERVRRPLRYRVVSQLSDRLPAPMSPKTRRLNLALPQGIAPRSVALALRWRAAARSDRDVIEQALAYFTRNLSYILAPGALPTRADPTDYFLFERRAGFCEHMAGSFAVLMRAAGIPARVVTGYQGGTWNALGGFVQVRQSDAHAWTEVWMEDAGWVRIDPTAAISPQRVERGIAAAPGMAAQLPLLARTRLGGGLIAALQQAWDNVNFQWQRWVLAYGPDRQWALLRRLGFDRPDWRHLAWVLGGGLGLLAAAFTLWALRSAGKRPRDPVRAVWRDLERRLTRQGLAPQRGETPWATAKRAAQAWPACADELDAIAKDYMALRYAPRRGGLDRAAIELRRRIRRLDLRRLRRRCGDTSSGAGDCGPDAGPPPAPPVDWRNRPG